MIYYSSPGALILLLERQEWPWVDFQREGRTLGRGRERAGSRTQPRGTRQAPGTLRTPHTLFLKYLLLALCIGLLYPKFFCTWPLMTVIFTCLLGLLLYSNCLSQGVGVPRAGLPSAYLRVSPGTRLGA